MSTVRRIAELERERSEQWTVLELASARIRGIDAELGHLKAGADVVGKLSDEMLTEAILTVLRSSASAMSPSAIIDRLKVGGREESATKVNATLSYLKQCSRVRHEGRAAWRAI
ncbi:hypothetical protein [Gemmatimonas sp.]|uniref:hypothetical protein n=1 Tax=Gemmatimonas sp. TaxID=1962908 RepID=UPI003568B683